MNRARVAALVRVAAIASVIAASAGTAFAADRWLPFSDGPGGATCGDYDRASGVAWRQRGGDWIDADGQPGGPRPYAEQLVQDTDQSRPVTFDVTRLAREWTSGAAPNFGMMLRVVPKKPAGDIGFMSREADGAESRPELVLEYEGAEPRSLAPEADTNINCTTYRSLGQAKVFVVGRGSPGLVRFALPADAAGRTLRRATLRLVTTDRQFGSAAIGVYRLDAPLDVGTPVVRQGVASARARDAGLDRDEGVVLVEDFDSSGWQKHWTHVGDTPWTIVSQDPSLRFEPLSGKALKVAIPKGRHLGLDIRYMFKERTGEEPDEIYFRYYLRFAEDWNPTKDGGKLPGIAGTYNRGGWGGRRSDGRNGWSMRGGFGLVVREPHPLAGGTPIGTYAYHADQRDTYGDHWAWSQGRPGVLERNRWYCLEQYVKVNTPGQRDGVMRAWIDGVQVMERTNVRVRDVDDLHIDAVWLDVYHGGTEVSPADQHLYIDQVVIARQYIGPMKR